MTAFFIVIAIQGLVRFNLDAGLVDKLERRLEGFQKAVHIFAENDDGAAVKGFTLARLALDDAQKYITCSILFYIKKICSLITDKPCRIELSANTHCHSLKTSCIVHDASALYK